MNIVKILYDVIRIWNKFVIILENTDWKEETIYVKMDIQVPNVRVVISMDNILRSMKPIIRKRMVVLNVPIWNHKIKQRIVL